MSDLLALLSRFPDYRVWVVGDVMLDEYIKGGVERISPEAPVPVVKVEETFSLLGGAANVARSLAALGARVSLCGAIGEDDAGDLLVRYCHQDGIDDRALVRVPDRPTTRKLRVLGPHQQLLRLDWEQTTSCPESLTKQAVETLGRGPSPHAVILSDYAKGFLGSALIHTLIDQARRLGVPILVDPKGRDMSPYRGASVLKPNLRELEEITGRDLTMADTTELATVCSGLASELEIETVVLTLGERGMLVAQASGESYTVPARSRQVYDVTGAGDTAIALLALALAAGAPMAAAANLANTGAGLVVDEVGAACIGADRLAAELRPGGASKVLSREALAEQVAAWRRRGERIVFTNGCFDLLHPGHLSLLQQASELGDVLVVGLNSDRSVSALKGPDRPLVNEKERTAILAALQYVDAVTLFDEETPLELIREIEPDVLVKGQDYRVEDVVGRELVEAKGGEVTLVPLLPQHSTTNLIERIRRGPASRALPADGD